MMLATLAVLLVTASPDPAVEQARTHFKTAERLYHEARYTEAIAEFQEAYRIRAHGVLFFNIGKCYEQLGDIPNALRNYRRYLHEIPGAKDKSLVNAAIGNLEKRLAAKGVQQLLVFAEPGGSVVEVDAKNLGTAPVSVELRPGPHRIVVTHEGFEAATRDVMLPQDHSLEMDVALSATNGPSGLAVTSIEAFPPPPPPPLPNAALEPVTVTPARSPAATVTSSTEQTPYRTASYVAAGATVVGIAAGVGLGEWALSTRAQMTTQVHNANDVQQLSDAIVGRSTGANVAYGAAAVCAVTAVVLFILSQKGGAGSPPTSAGTF